VRDGLALCCCCCLQLPERLLVNADLCRAHGCVHGRVHGRVCAVSRGCVHGVCVCCQQGVCAWRV
jgi:hypothetical protein